MTGEEMYTINEIYDLASQIERNGEAFFREAIKKISNPSLSSLFEWLADEEVKHSQWFARKKESAKAQGEDIHLEEMGSSILKAVLGDQSFALKEADLSKIEKVDDLLALAVEFEKDTILFFEMIGAFIEDPETAKHIKEIIDEENRHVELLQGSQGPDGRPREMSESIQEG